MGGRISRTCASEELNGDSGGRENRDGNARKSGGLRLSLLTLLF